MKFNMLRIKHIVLIVLSALLSVVYILMWSMPSGVPNRICLSDSLDKPVCGEPGQILYQYTMARISAQLQHLNKEYPPYVIDVDDENKGNFGKDKILGRKPAARLVMDHPMEKVTKYEGKSLENTAMVPVKGLKPDKELGGFLGFGMSSNDGRIMVPFTGTYSESSYVVMSSLPGSSGSVLRHALYKYNLKENRETELITNTKPKQSNDNSIRQGSFLNTVVNLVSGEEVLVKLSDNAYLPDPRQNYVAVCLN